MIFLPLIEKALNQYLALDPEIRERLKPLTGRVLRITVTTLQSEFYIKVSHLQLILLDQYHEAIDASLSGGVMDFIYLWARDLQGKNEISKDVIMTGDIHLIQRINQLFKQVDINWEEHLSQLTGDTVAHHLGNLVRNTSSWLAATAGTMKENLKEYLQEEKKIVAHPHAIEDFCDDVDVLRMDVERIEAKIERIKDA